ncbi:hypothetical protein [Peribacillus butanolivorans]|uniref:hypothetical protein n=1 Tax=Peribacillus butanolivorans TaxID=421767 RepID=UPI00365533DA
MDMFVKINIMEEGREKVKLGADGRDGFQNIFLNRGFSTYLIDQPRRGQAGRSTVEGQITPVAESRSKRGLKQNM